jgi:hypothetical protein
MPTSDEGSVGKRYRRDLVVAASAGLATACILAVSSFLTSGNLTADYPWLYIFQMPGTEIALRLFGSSGVLRRYSGVFVVQTSAILIQALVFTMMILGLLYVSRMYSDRRTRQKSPIGKPGSSRSGSIVERGG